MVSAHQAPNQASNQASCRRACEFNKFQMVMARLMREPGILLAGHSHLNALAGARHAINPEIRKLEGYKNFFVLDGPWPRDDPYWETMTAGTPDYDLALIWGGNEHNSLYFFEDAFKFDLYSTRVGRMLPGLQLISTLQVKRRFRNLTIDDLTSNLAKRAGSTARRIFLIGTPPPKKDNAELESFLPMEPNFQQWAAQINADRIKITDPFVRLKLWYILQDVFAEEAAKVGGTFVPVPDDVRDGEGFLRREYWADDITHANALYGKIVLDHLARVLPS